MRVRVNRRLAALAAVLMVAMTLLAGPLAAPAPVDAV